MVCCMVRRHSDTEGWHPNLSSCLCLQPVALQTQPAYWEALGSTDAASMSAIETAAGACRLFNSSPMPWPVVRPWTVPCSDRVQIRGISCRAVCLCLQAVQLFTNAMASGQTLDGSMLRQSSDMWHLMSSSLLVPAGWCVGDKLLTRWEPAMLQYLSRLLLLPAGCSVLHRSHGQCSDVGRRPAVDVRP